VNATPIGGAVGGLGARLRAVRESAGLSGAELARRLGTGWGQSKISKIETGRQVPSSDEVARWASETGADAERLLALHAKAFAQYGAWRERIAAAGDAAAFQDEISALEHSCTFLAEFQPAMIPGRLQTPAYMHEMSQDDEFLADDGVDDLRHLVARKVRRQSILYEPGRRIVHVVGEAALRTRIRGVTVETLRGQLAHLAEVATLPGHELGLLPFDRAWPIAPATGFGMYDSDLVIIEALVGDIQLTDPDAVARYNKWLEQLLDASVRGGDAAEYCRQVAGEL
jgi:transcriptional regulator with XRE-family HTH domain